VVILLPTGRDSGNRIRLYSSGEEQGPISGSLAQSAERRSHIPRLAQVQFLEEPPNFMAVRAHENSIVAD
jgi:hypothetical protein